MLKALHQKIQQGTHSARQSGGKATDEVRQANGISAAPRDEFELDDPVQFGHGVVALFPLLRSLGPLPKKTLEHTDWKKGSYLVTQDGRRIHVDDFIVNEVATVFPEGFQDTENGQAVDQTIVIRLDTEDYVTMKGRESWAPAGYVAYSKLCSHLGCPVGLYEQALQLLVCPCHQSMFDVTIGAVPNFGPAPRPLPQLPLYIDRDGYLRSQSDYKEPVGPGYWERS